MKEKINIIKRKNILILLFLNIIIISLILSMITKIEVKQINIGMVKKELNTNVDIEKIWDSSRLIKQNIKNNNDNNNNDNNIYIIYDKIFKNLIIKYICYEIL